ncbi:phosphatase and actin regulator 1-like isoform X3 [Amphibalanus amphitrite]|uniref:phosphatase and actin regulator 1-like isoform X3 n=1 Tax=Amphibalanus amphitrite TaxID=1232801 RepID=UPI001C91CD2E|nr:phosphatase and actin regulator 1-like isoform X3 [Amphibalanus amphitrite]
MAVQMNSVYFTTPRPRAERSASVDHLDFQQRRQAIASALSFSDLISGHKVAAADGRLHGDGAGRQTAEMGSTLPSAHSPRSRTPPVERKQKFAGLGRLFKPWKWKRKKKSDKFAETQRSLERKISMRSNRDDLIQKGILLPDSATSSPSTAAPASDAPDLLKERDLLNGAVSRSSPPAQHQTPPATPAAAAETPPPPPPRPERPERPASLGAPPAPAAALRGAEPTAEPRLSLSRLPEPPIGVTEIGLIPPPAMFSNGGATAAAAAAAAAAAVPPPPPPTAAPPPPPPGLLAGTSVNTAVPLDLSDPRFDDLEEEEVMFGDDDDDDEYYPMAGGGRGDEPALPPPREPRLDLVPLKSALKKPRPPSEPAAPPGSGQQDPAQGALLTAGGGDRRPVGGAASSGEDSDDSDGPILYRDEPAEGESGVLTRLGSRVQRSDSLAIKLALRPDRQELIDRNIIHAQTEQDRTDWRSELSAKLNRRLSLRPTAEELESRNILKTMTNEESQREMENKKATLLRKLSFRPTVEELKQRKVIHFNEYVDVTQAHEYDRRADKPWTRLTPRDKAMIRKELNDFKSSEMDVHEESRHLTRFHRP